jgi:uncharacterized protein YndB with AHSA1/START domain
MTRHRSFKRLVRVRMAKTGESYTAARATLLAAREPGAGPGPALATSDEMIRQRTGRGWEEWFDLLDEAGLAERPHRDIARWVADRQGVAPLAWAAQAVTVSYERARGGRAVGQRPDGFAITASRTLGIPVGRLFNAFADEAERGRWLADADLRERSATKPRSARFDWGHGRTRVNVTFQAKGEARSTVTVEHARLPDAAAAARMKAWWRERLTTLEGLLGGRESDA